MLGNKSRKVLDIPADNQVLHTDLIGKALDHLEAVSADRSGGSKNGNIFGGIRHRERKKIRNIGGKVKSRVTQLDCGFRIANCGLRPGIGDCGIGANRRGERNEIIESSDQPVMGSFESLRGLSLYH
jgi:hypothetical protein